MSERHDFLEVLTRDVQVDPPPRSYAAAEDRWLVDEPESAGLAENRFRHDRHEFRCILRLGGNRAQEGPRARGDEEKALDLRRLAFPPLVAMLPAEEGFEFGLDAATDKMVAAMGKTATPEGKLRW